MDQNQLHGLNQLESDLWETADQLRANSKLTSTEYCMPVLGVILLRHAANRFDAATKQIEAADCSLTPGRYVGVAPQEEDDDFDFKETFEEIHDELAVLNTEALKLAKKIAVNAQVLLENIADD